MQADHIAITPRYEIRGAIGIGGMGTVYHAYDRLHGRDIALKHVTVSHKRLSFSNLGSHSGSTDIRLALAEEFRTLASLRHPHIISVLDYGFDEQQQPFFTMNLLRNSVNLIEAGRHLRLKQRYELLRQTMQALIYLHRRDIIHRDLKPENIHVTTDGQVRVLDFGLALARERRDSGIAGTLAYMAPELMFGQGASKLSDLYALGVLACELFTGMHPYAVGGTNQLVDHLCGGVLDLSDIDLHPDIVAVLERLMQRDPELRYQSVREAMQAFNKAFDHPAPPETADIRESYLRSAPFVGRHKECHTLTQALDDALKGKGSAWLIGGESGSGKTRLLEELRIQALVGGALVLNGQAISQGSAPYRAWRDILRYLSMVGPLSDLEMGVVKAIVPDLERIIGREAADPPRLDTEGAANRIITIVESLLRRVEKPLVLILEDLHWASESIPVLQRIASIAPYLPLLVLGSYRHEEGPELPQSLPAMQIISLPKLDDATIADLSAALLGEETGRQENLLDLLQRNTRGNIFFIIEMVRTLAEEAGELEGVARITLQSRRDPVAR